MEKRKMTLVGVLTVIKLVLFTLGLLSLSTGAFLLDIVTGFIATGALLVGVSVALNKEIKEGGR